MEQVFYNLHSRIGWTISRNTTPKKRFIIENSLLFLAVCSFCLVNVSHLMFCCSSSRSHGRNGLNRLYFRRLFPSSILDRSSRIPYKCLRSINGFREDVNVTSIVLFEDDGDFENDRMRNGNGFVEIFNQEIDSVGRNCNYQCPYIPPNTTNIIYSYSSTSGFLLLDGKIRHQLGIQEQVIYIPSSSSTCFGSDPLIRKYVVPYLGRDTIVLNWFLGAFDDVGGYLYHHGTKQLINLNTLVPKEQPPYIVVKLGVIFTSIFLFFVTTTLVRFTLLETQQKMLTFTLLLQNTIRNRQPFARLIMAHVAQTFLFVPIMVGILFFLVSFYLYDKILAFWILSVVWMCESFSVISVRTLPAQYFFPRVFFLYFSLFHIYFFSYKFGFHYWSLASSILFLFHVMCFFWNRYELPALERGLVSALNPRVGQNNTIQVFHHNVIPNQTSHSNSVSRTTSRSILADDDDSSYMVYLNGEVVMHRELSSSSISNTNFMLPSGNSYSNLLQTSRIR